MVNNSRYLLLPPRQQYPNLGSCVLSLCLRRLSRDWQERWGHPVLVVESFVDETQYRGTCYRGCGFDPIGATGGFARNSRDFYLEHERPKQLYLKALVPEARRWLRRSRLPAELAAHEEAVAGPCPFQAPELGSLLERFRQLPDAHRGHGLYHRQRFVLSCAAVATLMGACGYRAYEDTCKKFTQRQLRALGCQLDEATRKYRAPSDSTFRRVVMRVDPGQFAALVGQWLLEQEVSAVARLAVDGKTLRGSGRRDGRPLQLLSAVTHHLRLTLGQLPIEEKSNEIPALRPLLESLTLPEGVLVTADPMHCQQESAAYITQELGGDYLFGLKGNQSGVLERAERELSRRVFPLSRERGVGKAP